MVKSLKMAKLCFVPNMPVTSQNAWVVLSTKKPKNPLMVWRLCPSLALKELPIWSWGSRKPFRLSFKTHFHGTFNGLLCRIGQIEQACIWDVLRVDLFFLGCASVSPFLFHVVGSLSGMILPLLDPGLRFSEEGDSQECRGSLLRSASSFLCLVGSVSVCIAQGFAHCMHSGNTLLND